MDLASTYVCPWLGAQELPSTTSIAAAAASVSTATATAIAAAPSAVMTTMVTTMVTAVAAVTPCVSCWDKGYLGRMFVNSHSQRLYMDRGHAPRPSYRLIDVRPEMNANFDFSKIQRRYSYKKTWPWSEGRDWKKETLTV